LDFPDELPEVKGLPWEESEEDWVKATAYYGMYKNDPVFWTQMKYLKQSVEQVGVGVEVGGAE
jgi:hypothetical protein